MATALSLNACASTPNVRIPDSLKRPCVSTVDVSGAQTVGDLSRAIIQGDADLRVCSAEKEAVISIVEGERRPWWSLLRPG